MKKPTLTTPAVYSFDDTPKAFKRMLQRKNGNPETYKKFKQEQKDYTPVSSSKRSFFEGEPQTVSSNKTFKPSDRLEPSNTTHTATHSSKLPQNNLATGFKTVRAKRKAHLQNRDLKKKLKKFDATRELPQHNSVHRKDVRDVVQEPPRLHQVKKAYKKVMDDSVDLKSWSDDDELAEDNGHE